MKKLITLSLSLLFVTGVSFANLDGKGCDTKEGAKSECCSSKKTSEKSTDNKSADNKETAKNCSSKDEGKDGCCSKKGVKKARKTASLNK